MAPSLWDPELQWVSEELGGEAVARVYLQTTLQTWLGRKREHLWGWKQGSQRQGSGWRNGRRSDSEFRGSGREGAERGRGARGPLRFAFMKGSVDTKKRKISTFLGPYLGQKISVWVLARLGSGSQSDELWLLELESLLIHRPEMAHSSWGWGRFTAINPPPSHLLHSAFCYISLIIHPWVLYYLCYPHKWHYFFFFFFFFSAQQSKSPLTLIFCAADSMCIILDVKQSPQMMFLC